MCIAAVSGETGQPAEGTIPFDAVELEAFGEGNVTIAAASILHYEPEQEGVEPAAESIPLAQYAPSGVGFNNHIDGLDIAGCVAELQGEPSETGQAFTIGGVAYAHRAAIDGVEYSLDEGETWYTAEPVDGMWGGAREEFTMDVSVQDAGLYEVLVRPVTAGERWDEGYDVFVDTTEATP